MRITLALVALVPAAFALQGCLAKTALDIATLPDKVVSEGVDLATTSQSEADEKRGREIRRREERLARLEGRYREERAECEAGDRSACEDARATYSEIEAVLPTVPLEPED